MVLENLSFGFLKSNILDVKLGTVLYDKVARIEKAARVLIDRLPGMIFILIFICNATRLRSDVHFISNLPGLR